MKNRVFTQNRIIFILVTVLLVFVIQSVGYAQGRGKIYWTEYNSDTKVGVIRRANLNGNASENVVTDIPPIVDIALDLRNHKIYWSENFTAKIQRANFDGSNIENIVTGYDLPPGGGGMSIRCRNWKCEGTATPKDGAPINLTHEQLIDPNCIAIDTDANKIYWGNGHLDIFQRANFDGSDIEDLIIREQILPFKIKFKQWLQPLSIALDLEAGKIYWTDAYGRKIQRANLDGSDAEDLVTDMRTAYGLALDLQARQMYWTNTVTGKIQRASLNGNRVEDLVTGLRFPSDLVLDPRARKMYWIDIDLDTDIGKIQRANLDGSNVRNILTGLDYPSDIALDPNGFYDVTPDTNKLTTTWANVKVQ
jgi:hypothetical protein